MQFSRTKCPHIHTARTVQSWFKNEKVNMFIFSGYHNHKFWTSLNHSGQFWRLRVRNRFQSPTSLKELKDVHPE
jgi:hypothetical protein